MRTKTRFAKEVCYASYYINGIKYPDNVPSAEEKIYLVVTNGFVYLN
jgi:hypothetical protein